MFYGILLFFCISCLQGESTSPLRINQGNNTLKKEQIQETPIQLDPVDFKMELLRQQDEKAIFEYTKCLMHEDVKVCLNTTALNDTLSNEHAIDYIFLMPVIKSQALQFYQGDQLLHTHSIPLRTSMFTTQAGEKTEGLKITIYKLGLIEGRQGRLWQVSGSGMCIAGSCLEFEGYYALDGAVIYESYNDDFDQKELFEMYNQQGIDHEERFDYIAVDHRVDVFWVE